MSREGVLRVGRRWDEGELKVSRRWVEGVCVWCECGVCVCGVCVWCVVSPSIVVEGPRNETGSGEVGWGGLGR